ncbi:hypothetical protein [Vibrio sp. WXL210]|uniref:hypothetical protein n=1 Tax=Vibrio sp. WXL210 TaxID=3450709 RepID=UPI003EC8EE6F
MKNWTVITKPVKKGTNGVLARERYLKSSSHPNHANTEAIIDIVGNENTSKNIIIAGERYRLNQKLRSNRRGRPLSSYAMEFCLTLPKPYRPSPEQWRTILGDCCKALANHLKLTGDERKLFYSLIRGVCHQQNQQGRSAGDHCHLIISKVLKDRILTDLQRKRATAVLKQAFTASTTVHLGISVDSYKPHELNRGKRLEKWQYESRKYQEQQDSNNKILQKLEKQIDKWQLALESHDAKQLRRQRNRIEKTLTELDISLDSSALSTRIKDILG